MVVAYTVAVAGGIGLVPADPGRQRAPANLTVVLREEGRGGTAGAGARTLRRALVVAQVAFAFVLLVGAGLLFASFRQVLAVQPGFNPDGILTAAVSLPQARYADDKALIGFTDEALRRLRELLGRHGGRRDRHHSLRRQPQRQRDLRRGLPDEARRVGDFAEPGGRLARGTSKAIGARLVRGRYFDDRDGPLGTP